MRKKMYRLLWIVFLLILLEGCNIKPDTEQTIEDKSNNNDMTDLNIFIGAGLKNSMEEIKLLYNKKNPAVNILFNADSSGKLQLQIEEGAECDLFFPASIDKMQALEEKGLIKNDSVINLLTNKVVLIKPKGEKTAVTGFETITKAKNIALAGEEVPIGEYSREIFKNLGIFDDVMHMEINQGANVTEVLTSVSEKSNEIGVVYATDAKIASKSVEIIATASEGLLDNPIIYPVGLVKKENADVKKTEAAKDFLQFLVSDEAVEIFEDFGFIKK
ncbi:molybdate ABC transporter substrate-binding protein [Anaerosacchariphilus polymeriproducens]|uniref:Molybdate ABC transporter substrate-binding protein n=1 Tax=Anaerosacchariphilus polymeriproducens TaxID=1812858 RepID=A0A371AUA5_9FIRM|nr:molybdate ABC transporter substrate-binding protein [Anaerosacchariphilus polymeriproducens]RDU23148.1 molybdate ABC transporter substrate-binding protein [Anaerosacchariphilus polymeriproducens]